MSTLTLRGCDEELARVLKETSALRGLSVNRLILETLRETLMGRNKPPRRHHDLDDLAGTWTAAEAEEFQQATAEFEGIDRELWRP